MIDLADVARQEEQRQARGLAKVAPEQLLVAGGCAGRGEAGSWVNNAVGVGLDGAVPDAKLDALVEWFVEKHIEPRVELSPYADRSVVTGLASRGFVIRDWENTFYREIDSAKRTEPAFAPPTDVQMILVDPSDDDMVREYSTVSMSGFFPPGAGPSEFDYEVAARWVKQPRVLSVAAVVGDRLVAAGSASLDESVPIVSLAGLSVLPEFRRRGIQQALIAHRLNLAAARGATLATIGSRPGAATERNVRRMGFQLAYTKAHVVMPRADLVPNVCH